MAPENNELELYRELELEGIEKKVADAIRKAKRELFVPASMKGRAYENIPLPIGYGQTISQPSMVAVMTQELDVRKGDKILEVGTGSGWQAAILKELAGEKGRVVSIERIPELAEFARKNLKKAGYEVEVQVGDGSLGWGKEKYDRIIVTAGAPEIPQRLVEQLKTGGRLVIPIGSRHYQELTVVEKTKEGIKVEKKGGCIFVPLIGEAGWKIEQIE